MLPWKLLWYIKRKNYIEYLFTFWNLLQSILTKLTKSAAILDFGAPLPSRVSPPQGNGKYPKITNPILPGCRNYRLRMYRGNRVKGHIHVIHQNQFSDLDKSLMSKYKMKPFYSKQRIFSRVMLIANPWVCWMKLSNTSFSVFINARFFLLVLRILFVTHGPILVW